MGRKKSSIDHKRRLVHNDAKRLLRFFVTPLEGEKRVKNKRLRISCIAFTIEGKTTLKFSFFSKKGGSYLAGCEVYLTPRNTEEYHSELLNGEEMCVFQRIPADEYHVSIGILPESETPEPEGDLDGDDDGSAAEDQTIAGGMASAE